MRLASRQCLQHPEGTAGTLQGDTPNSGVRSFFLGSASFPGIETEFRVDRRSQPSHFQGLKETDLCHLQIVTGALARWKRGEARENHHEVHEEHEEHEEIGGQIALSVGAIFSLVTWIVYRFPFLVHFVFISC